jgi:hypothetical protein
MGTSANFLPCDGCGLPASPEHVAARLRRLELCTRFRPVHIGILFVALAPPTRPQDDFYAPAQSKEFFNLFLEALEILPSKENAVMGSQDRGLDSARLAEFQHRGYYLAYVSECPIPEMAESAAETIARLSPTLVRRIRFNYKPKYIALLGTELTPLTKVLAAEFGSDLILDRGQPLPAPRTGSRAWVELVRSAVASVARGELLASGYDRIQVTRAERNLEAGGKP